MNEVTYNWQNNVISSWTESGNSQSVATIVTSGMPNLFSKFPPELQLILLLQNLIYDTSDFFNSQFMIDFTIGGAGIHLHRSAITFDKHGNWTGYSLNNTYTAKITWTGVPH